MGIRLCEPHCGVEALQPLLPTVNEADPWKVRGNHIDFASYVYVVFNWAGISFLSRRLLARMA